MTKTPQEPVTEIAPCPFCKQALRNEHGKSYTHPNNQEIPCPMNGMGWTTDSRAFQLWPRVNVIDEDLPETIYAIAKPWGEWAETEEYAKHKSEISFCDAPYALYTRADSRPVQPEEIPGLEDAIAVQDADINDLDDLEEAFMKKYGTTSTDVLWKAASRVLELQKGKNNA